MTGAAGEVVMDSGEKRLNELGYKQELRREMVRFSTPFFSARATLFLVFGSWTVPAEIKFSD